MVRLFLIISTAAVTFTTAAMAGCPAPPPEPVVAEITYCRFYDAAADQNLKASIEEHFSRYMAGETEESLAERRARILYQNTGAIIEARIGGKDETAFLRSGNPAICSQFHQGNIYKFNLEHTCPMVYFQAPENNIFSLPAPESENPESENSALPVIEKPDL